MADMGGVGKASQEMIKELQQLQKQDQQSKPNEGGAKFNQALQNNAATEAQSLAKIQEASKLQQTHQAQKPSSINQAVHSQSVRVTEVKKAPSMLDNAVKEMMAGQNKLEELMKVAMGGQKLSNQEMIGIQAGVYMYSQQMELVSKVIEKATSGIKQTMNTQV